MVKKVTEFVSKSTTKKAFWGFLSAGFAFVVLSIVFEWNDATMEDFHEFCDFAWKAMGTFLATKAGIDGARILKG